MAHGSKCSYLSTGAALTYYLGCINQADSISILTDAPDLASATTYTPASCRKSCLGASQKYAALTPDGSNTHCFCFNTFDDSNKVSDVECSSVCSGFATATCGSTGFLSVYITSAFEYSLGSVEAIVGFNFNFVGIDGFTVIQGQNVPIRFRIESGNNVEFFVYGDQRLEEIETYHETSYVVFPEPGTYLLTAAAVNAANRQEVTFTVTVLEDTDAIKHLTVTGGTGEVNVTAKIQIVMVGGKGASCSVKFGDGNEETCSNCETVNFIEHVYLLPGVYETTMDCTAGYNAISSSASILVIEPISIDIPTSFQLLYGKDLLVPFNVSGTNISEIQVTFDTASLTKTCDSSFNCQTLITSNDYVSIGLHVLRVEASNEMSSSLSAFSSIFIGTPVDGLVVKVSKSRVFINESINVTISISDGTKTFITLSIGDYKQLYICEISPCDYIITVVFPDPGLYQVEVEASNDFTAKQTENIAVMIYQPVPQLQLTLQNVTSILEPVTLRIESNADVWPNDAVASVVAGEHITEVAFEETETGVFSYKFNPLGYGIFPLKVNISNALQFVELSGKFQIGSVVYGLSVEVFPDVLLVDKDVDIVIGITDGNPINITIDFGDGESVAFYNDIGSSSSSSDVFQIDAPSRIMTLTHRYTDVGKRIINITAHNVFGSAFANTTLILHRELEGLYLTANVTVIAPREKFAVALELEKSAPLPWNTSCKFDFGDRIMVQDVDLKVTHANAQFMSHTYAEPCGNITIHVVCSNQVSSVAVSLNLTVMAPVTNCAIDGPLYIATGESASFKVILEGSHFNLDIDTGNERNIREERERLVSDSEVYKFDARYSQPGVFHILATSTNALSICKSNVTLQVFNPILEGNFELLLMPDVVDIRDASVTVSVDISSSFKVPSEVLMFIDFGDDATMNASYPVDESIKHVYQSTGLYEISIIFKNLVSRWKVSKSVLVMESVREFWFNHSSTLNAVGETVRFSMSTRFGTNLTYTINYGDSNVDSQFMESATLVKFTHRYTNPGKYFVTFTAGNELGHMMDNNTKIRVVTPIRGLNLKAEPDVIFSPGSINLTLAQEAGKLPPSDMDCTWNFGDESNNVVNRDIEVSENASVVIEKSYPGGLFDVFVTCRNPLSKTTMKSRVKVYEKISTAEMKVDDSIIQTGTEVTFTVRLTSGSLVLFSLNFGDGFHEYRNITQSEDAYLQTFMHQYNKAGKLQARLVASNGITTENNLDLEMTTLELTVLHGTDMFKLSYESSEFIPPGKVRYILSVLPDQQAPQVVNLNWTFGDGKIHQTDAFFNGTDMFTITHFYETADVYDVEVIVSNEVDTNNYATTVALSKKVPQLRVYVQYSDAEGTWLSGHGPDLNWMPARTELKFFANTTLENLDTSWKFGDGTEELTSEIAYHTYEKVGWYNVTLKVHNASDTFIEECFDLFIVGDPISLRLSTLISEGLTEDVWVDSESTYVLEAAIHPGPSCVIWDMGDSSPVVIYGPPPCVVYAITDEDIFVEIDRYSPGSFEHIHTYDSPGYYKVRVNVENYVTIRNATVKDVAIVKGCSNPIQVLFSGSGQDMYNPRQFLRSEKIPLDPVVSFPCVGIENPDFVWTAKLLRILKGGFVLPTTYEIENSPRPRRIFEPLTFKTGLYEVFLTVSVPDHPTYTGEDSIFIDVEASPLVVKIEGGTSRSVGSVEPLIVDATTSSYDPDNPEGSATSWRYMWQCFRIHNVNFATSSPISTEMEDIPRQCDSPYSQTLDTFSGVLQLDAMTLRIGSMYNFRVTAWAGKKSATTKQLVIIKQGDLPAVSIK